MSNLKVKLLTVRPIKLKQRFLFLHAKPCAHLSSLRITLLLVSFSSAGKYECQQCCAAMHEAGGVLCSDECGFVEAWLKSKGEICDCLQVVLTFITALCILESEMWDHCLLTDLPALLSSIRTDLKQRFGKWCLQGVVCGLPLEKDPKLPCTKEDHSFRLCRAGLELIWTNSYKVVWRRDSVHLSSGMLDADLKSVPFTSRTCKLYLGSRFIDYLLEIRQCIVQTCFDHILITHWSDMYCFGWDNRSRRNNTPLSENMRFMCFQSSEKLSEVNAATSQESSGLLSLQHSFSCAEQ